MINLQSIHRLFLTLADVDEYSMFAVESKWEPNNFERGKTREYKRGSENTDTPFLHTTTVLTPSANGRTLRFTFDRLQAEARL